MDNPNFIFFLCNLNYFIIVSRIIVFIYDGQDDDIFLDIGANAGYYGLYAARKVLLKEISMCWIFYQNCLVRFYEPQPTCRNWIQAAILVNEYQSRTGLTVWCLQVLIVDSITSRSRWRKWGNVKSIYSNWL